MKIGFDARFITKNKRGIGKYSANLLSNLLRIDSRNKYILYFDKEFDESFLPSGSKFELRSTGNGHSVLYEQYFLPKQIQKDKLDLFHSPGNIPPILCSTKKVVTLHDTIMFQPEMSIQGGLYNFYLRKALLSSTKTIRKIITISNHSKNDIIKLFPWTEEKIVVIHEAVDDRFKPLQDENAMETTLKKYKVRQPFILHFGSNDPRKNTLRAIKVYHRLTKENNIPHQLILVGLGRKKNTPIDAYLNEYNLNRQVVSIEFLPEDDLPSFYHGAAFLLYISLYEGFGLPPLEAMACCTPVVASNVSSIPEIVGEGAVLVDPRDESGIYKSCVRILNCKNGNKELIERGLENLKHFLGKKALI